jgi:beta-lactamase superfamily II metal-dependent hydrolase
MSTKIKSFSVGDGDMFYIDHALDSLTLIDCSLPSDDYEKSNNILKEIKGLHVENSIIRFVSTHPDQDHMRGLKELDDEINILNFYCTENKATKEDETVDFKHYRQLRDDKKKSFYLYEGCMRKWINEKCTERGGAGINILWPIVDNEHFQNALRQANSGESPNNISPIIKYGLNGGATVVWMGDLEKDFMENIVDEITLPKVNVLFAPHHGRDSGRIPEKWLKQMNPDIIVIGEAPSDNLNYYNSYNTITQNSAKDITFICNTEPSDIDIYVENSEYTVDFLKNYNLENISDGYYIGTLNL